MGNSICKAVLVTQGKGCVNKYSVHLRTLMPRFGGKAPPEGWDLLEPTIRDFERRMREAEIESHEGKRVVEAAWPIFRIHHARSRYIYEQYKSATISRQLYDWCLKEGIADGELIAKWKKQGYEMLCCLRCIQPKDTNYGATCICRVPRKDLDEGKGGGVSKLRVPWM